MTYLVPAMVVETSAILIAQALPDPYGPLLTYGPLGIFAALLLTSRIVSRAELDRANARADRAEAQRDELAQRMVSDVVPLVTEVQRTMVPALRDVADGQKAMISAVDKLQQAVDRFIDRRAG